KNQRTPRKNHICDLDLGGFAKDRNYVLILFLRSIT
ncbi:hypothetical protein A5875_002036, partial [Enterococcus sp. 3H8_DIV0648]